MMASAPLPVRDGVAPSRVFLPSGPWATVFEFLVERFPYLTDDVLHERMMAGDIVDSEGTAQRPDTPYEPQQWLWYYRQVPDEPPVPFVLGLLYQDEHILVVDKPHFLPSIPGGRHVQETALVRLRAMLNMPWLSPIHRLDKDTAGVMLFCTNPASRGAYQSLFQTQRVIKEYEAVASWREDLNLPCEYRSRLEPSAAHFVMQEVPGEPNSQTHIDIIERRGAWAHYRLRPLTGRKHQLRAHMNALGLPIRNDSYYPDMVEEGQADDWSRPLQLLARSIEFRDPITGHYRYFESQRRLSDWPPALCEQLHYEPVLTSGSASEHG